VFNAFGSKDMLEENDSIRDYTLIKFLGKGQFGEVWLAEKQLQFASRKFRHALKFLTNLDAEIDLKSPGLEVDPWIEPSGHPNVIPVLDMFVHKKRVIIASEYADGGSLKNWLTKSDGKAPSREEAIKMMLGILNGIEHLHSRNVIHRDLKPENILLQGSFPRITDFGISRIVSTDSMLTRVVGSPAYMSPESFDGIKSPQTDIWSAGVMLYEMLVGSLPFSSGTIFGLAASIRHDKMMPVPESVPPELRTVVETALQKDLEKRYFTALEMLTAIEQAAHDLKVRSKLQGARTELLFDLPGVIDPMAVTVSIDHPIGLASVITSTIDLDEDPISPPPLAYSNETQEAAVGSTGGFGPEIETQTDVAVVPVGLKAINGLRAFPIRSGVGLLAVLAGVIISPVLTGVLFYSAFSGFFGSSVSDKSGTRESGSAPLGGVVAHCGNLTDVPVNMVCIDGGEFVMGRDGGKIPDEAPAHTATVSPFLIDKYEVTNELYADFVQKTKRAKLPLDWVNGTFPKGKARFPVVGVDWNDASDYAKWADKRLPTEEEWEYAARGKDSRIYPWGNIWEAGNANADTDRQSLAEVGTFQGISPFDIYDMVGNAGEWTASDFKAYPKGRFSRTFAGLKTIRGNDFAASKEYATTTYRIGWAATGADDYTRTGFRCAKNLRE